jgi:hypothetical protein
MRERFVPLTAAQKADIEATEVKDRIQRSRSAAAAAAKFQFIADDQAQEERRVASPERWEPEPLPGKLHVQQCALRPLALTDEALMGRRRL